MNVFREDGSPMMLTDFDVMVARTRLQPILEVSEGCVVSAADESRLYAEAAWLRTWHAPQAVLFTSAGVLARDTE